MEQTRLEQPTISTPRASKQPGCYVYCVASGNEEVSLGAIGIESHEVHTIGHNDICVLVHDCIAHPYQSGDNEEAAGWVLAHHRVVETAWKRWDTVLPLTFNTIIKAEQGNAKENLLAWLKAEYGSLKGRLDGLAGKAEYVVQVFWNPVIIAMKVAETNPEIKKLEAEIGSKPRGLAYMYRQKLEGLLRKEIEARAAQEFKHLHSKLVHCVDNIHIEKTRNSKDGLQMLMNLSCLLRRERYPDLEMELNQVSNMEGYAVRLAGPLPPYSFC